MSRRRCARNFRISPLAFDRTPIAGYDFHVRRLVSISMLLVMLLFAASPVLACIVPEPQMSADERACCAKMAGDCGDMADSSMADTSMSNMDMSDSGIANSSVPASTTPDSTKNHSCCKKTVAGVQSAVLTKAFSQHLEFAHLVQPVASLTVAPATGFGRRNR